MEISEPNSRDFWAGPEIVLPLNDEGRCNLGSRTSVSETTSTEACLMFSDSSPGVLPQRTKEDVVALSFISRVEIEEVGQ